jgi:hypothetical protein
MIMPIVDSDGNGTRYVISGSGPPTLMMAADGFDSAIAKWSTMEFDPVPVPSL